MHSQSYFLLLLVAPLGAIAQRQRVSQDATCGASDGYTCLNSAWGNCCSQYGWCGRTSAYCGTGCNPKFGTCSPVSSSSIKTSIQTSSTASRASSASPSASSQPLSRNARCGPLFGGSTCLGTKWGDCCSQYSYCGSSIDYCNANTCQKGYGKCNNIVSSSSRIPSTLATSKSTSATSGSSSSSSKSSSLSASAAASTPSALSSLLSSSPSPSSSSTAVLSTSSTSPSSSTASSSIITSSSTSSASLPAPSCLNVPNCEPYTGSLTGSCQASFNKCHKDGYQSKCGLLPQSDSISLSRAEVRSTDGDLCASQCSAKKECVGFVFMVEADQKYYCTLYSFISGVTQGWGSSWLKVCADTSVRSSSAVASSTTAASVSSQASSSVNVPSSVASSSSASISSFSSITSTNSISSFGTTSTVSSSSMKSTSSVAPDSIVTPSSLPPVSSTPTPAPSVCPYLTRPYCPSYTLTTSLTDACPDIRGKCAQGYVVNCNARVYVSAGIVVYKSLGDIGGDACIAACDSDPECKAVTFSATSKVCDLFNTFNVGQTVVPNYSVYFKLCPPQSVQPTQSVL